MRFVSRDANITQFYGVAARGDDMLLISEFMEVRVEGDVTGASRVVLLACGWLPSSSSPMHTSAAVS